MTMLRMLAQTRKAAARPVYALVEQLSVSGGNFVLNTVLARTLDPASYGCFATAFVCSLFAAILHNGALLDPVSIVASRRSALAPEHVAAQLREHFRFCSLIALLPLGLGILVLVIGREPALGHALIMSGLTLPCLLVFPLIRRLLVISDRPDRAALAAVVYAALLVGGAIAMSAWVGIGFGSAYLLLAASSLVASTLLADIRGWGAACRLLRFASCRRVDTAQRQQAWFLVPAGALTFAVTQIQIPMIVLFLGTEHAGAYRAMQLPMIAVGQVIAAGVAMALPRLAAAFAAGDIDRAARRTRQLILASLIVCATAEAVLLVAHRRITEVLYNGQFLDSSWLMPVLGLVAIASCWGTAFGVALRAMQKARTQLVAAAVTAVISVPLGIALIVRFGMPGAAASAVISYLILSLMNAGFYAAAVRRPAEHSAKDVERQPSLA